MIMIPYENFSAMVSASKSPIASELKSAIMSSKNPFTAPNTTSSNDLFSIYKFRLQRALDGEGPMYDGFPEFVSEIGRQSGKDVVISIYEAEGKKYLILLSGDSKKLLAAMKIEFHFDEHFIKTQMNKYYE